MSRTPVSAQRFLFVLVGISGMSQASSIGNTLKSGTHLPAYREGYLISGTEP